jgi:hypothetical protein
MNSGFPIIAILAIIALGELFGEISTFRAKNGRIIA